MIKNKITLWALGHISKNNTSPELNPVNCGLLLVTSLRHDLGGVFCAARPHPPICQDVCISKRSENRPLLQSKGFSFFARKQKEEPLQVAGGIANW